MMKKFAATIAFIVSAAWVLTGCAFPGCTDASCASSLTVELNKSSAWEETNWQVTVKGDGSEIGTCQIELPGDSQGAEEACDHPLNLNLNESGGAIESVYVMLQPDVDVPTEYTVGVQRDGNLVVEQTFEPSYDTVRPNGPDCSPVCQQAEAELAF